MGFSTVPCNEFVEVLASKAPVPGGGGASALVGAIGTALGNMVGSLTVGKKKYADVEAEMYELKAKADALQKDLLHLIERDAEVFEPLSKAYGMPRETEEEKAEKAGKTLNENLFIIPDRKQAIRRAFKTAQKGDIVLLLGKSHENSIIYKDFVMPYDEIKEAEKALSELGYKK